MPTRLALVGVLMAGSCSGPGASIGPAPSPRPVPTPVAPTSVDLGPARAEEEAPAPAPQASAAADAARARLDQATGALAAGDRASALRDVEAAVALLAADPPEDFEPAHASAWVRAAVVGLRAGDREALEERLGFARAACERAPDERVAERAALRYELAAAADESGDLAGAMRESELGLADALRAHAADDAALQRARMRTAVHAGRGGNPRRARALQEEALAALERTVPTDDALRLQALDECAVTLYALGEVAEAVRRATAALAVREAGAGDERSLHVSRRNTASILLNAGDRAGAREITARWVADLSARKAPDDPGLLEARYVDGCVLRQLGEYAQCERVLTEALAATADSLPPDDPVRLAIQLERGSARHAQERLDAALADMEAVLAIRERVLPETDVRLLMARNSVAAVRADAGDLEGARELMQRALSRAERHFVDAHPELQRSRQNLAAVLYRLGDTAGGRVLLEKALAVRMAQYGPDHPSVLGSRLSLAITLQREGANADASAELTKVLEAPATQAPGQERFRAGAYKALAEARLGLDDARGAREAAQLALDLALLVVPPHHRDAQNARTVLAGALFALGDATGARAELDEVLRLAEAMPTEEARDIVLHALSDVLVLDRALGDRASVERHAGALLVTLRHAVRAARLDAPRAVGERARSLSRLLESAIGAVEPGSALDAVSFEVLETLRGLDTGADLRHGPIPPDLAEAAGRARSLRRSLTDSGGTADDLERLVRERDEIESGLHRELAARGLVPRDLELRELAAALGSDEAAVSIRRIPRPRPVSEPGRVQVADPAFTAWVVTPDARVRRFDLGLAGPIEAAVEDWRAALLGGDARNARGLGDPISTANRADIGAGEVLRRLVLDPILDALPEARRLYFSADDVLHLVAFDALPVGQGCVGDRLGVVVASSLSRVATGRSRPDASGDVSGRFAERLVVLGGADYDAGSSAPTATPEGAEGDARGAARGAPRAHWPALPGAAEEARVVAATFARERRGDVAFLTGARAGRAELLDELPSARWIHLATHGWFAAGAGLGEASTRLAPLSLCGLALAGANAPPDGAGSASGVLTAEELAAFDLSSCELAVLSACETGLGVVRGGRAVQSLQAALHAAGARSAITSLWKVEDEAANALFQDFYARVWRHREPKERALWSAKSALRAAGRPPRDWAGWVLSGVPD